MYKQDILKQWRTIFLSSLVFYLGFTIFGILPLLFFEDVLWERNFFFIVLGLILGAVMFVGFIVMLVMILLSAWPKIRTFDYLYIVIVLLSIGVVDLVMSEQSAGSEESGMMIFLIVGMLVIILQFIAHMMISKIDERTLKKKWKEGIKSLPSVNHSKKPQITKIIMTLLVVIVFVVLNNFENMSDRIVTFLVVLALGFYVLKLYHESFSIQKKQKVFDFVVFALSYVGVLVVLSFFSEFFLMHTVLKALIVLLPFTPYLWVIIPAFYTMYWVDKNRNMN